MTRGPVHSDYCQITRELVEAARKRTPWDIGNKALYDRTLCLAPAPPLNALLEQVKTLGAVV